MMLDEALFTHLTGNVALNTLIGVRLYPDVLPLNGLLPAVAYQWISTQSMTTRDGGGEPRIARFQFDVLADARLLASTVTLRLEAALIAFKQASGPKVTVTFLDNRSGIYEQETRFYRSTVDALVHYYESFT